MKHAFKLLVFAVTAFNVFVLFTSLAASNTAPKYCLRPKAPGSTCGGGPFTSWYFDSNSRACKAFIFGGCNGNLNRFSSERQCQRWCLPGIPENPVCSLDQVQGHGIGRFFAWSCDSKVNYCRVFLYGGWGGNSNNFGSCFECMNRCSGNEYAAQICHILNYNNMVYSYKGLQFSFPGIK
ncbi:amblin-like isoform X1 [Dermacentor variabilis]|uniref:amblin-like isoform X1 n=1 Tax=Dermacentor variabilis TaxID=34621 RepID=UPI003F5CB48F